MDVSNSEIILEFKTSGQESVDTEVQAFKMYLNYALGKALQEAKGKMLDVLKSHIESDVYSFHQRTYPRRSEHGGTDGNGDFGPALNNMKVNAKWSRTETQMHEKGVGGIAVLEYRPSGAHSGTTEDLDPRSPYYDADTPKPIKPKPAEADDLIRRIETGRGYDWETKVKARPFWQNTANELIEGGVLTDTLERGLMLYGPLLEIEPDGQIQRESGDGQY